MDLDLERWCNVMIPNDSMMICNAIIPPRIQALIDRAARRAHHFDRSLAEEARKHAGYPELEGGYQAFGPLTYEEAA
jgi:hypothetical protein